LRTIDRYVTRFLGQICALTRDVASANYE
jgi:hypothetical protein